MGRIFLGGTMGRRRIGELGGVVGGRGAGFFASVLKIFFMVLLGD